MSALNSLAMQCLGAAVGHMLYDNFPEADEGFHVPLQRPARKS